MKTTQYDAKGEPIGPTYWERVTLPLTGNASHALVRRLSRKGRNTRSIIKRHEQLRRR